MRRILLIVLFIALWNVVPTQAQTKTPCDLTAVIKTANGVKSSGDSAADLKALNTLSQQIETANIACNGLTFKGTGNKVLGPLVIPKGTYKVSVETKNAFILTLNTLSGSDCDANQTVSVMSQINLEGDRDASGQVVLPVGADCKVLMTTSNSSNPWTLTFEPVE